MEIGDLLTSGNVGPSNSPSSFSALGTDEFFQLIITELLNQDPLNPTDNDKLLEQISSIRNIEMNNEITSSLRTLASSFGALIGQQNLDSAAGLIGQFVETSVPSATSPGEMVSGVVSGFAISDQGVPALVIEGGQQVPVHTVLNVTSLEQVQNMIGQLVTAEMLNEENVQRVEGIVTGYNIDRGRIMLDLDSGEQIAFADVRDSREPSGLFG